jgi:hypothetical protein
MSPFPPLKGLPKALLFLCGLALVLVLWDAWLFHLHTPGWEPEFESTSPDGRFTTSVYYNPGVLPLPPGLNPRGRAGTVVLRENKTGKVLKRENTESVNAGTKTPGVTWDPKGSWVVVISIGAWDLPPEEPAK